MPNFPSAGWQIHVTSDLSTANCLSGFDWLICCFKSADMSVGNTWLLVTSSRFHWGIFTLNSLVFHTFIVCLVIYCVQVKIEIFIDGTRRIFWLLASACFGTFGLSFSTFKLLCLAKDHWWGFITRNAHMVHIVNVIRFKMV